MKQKLIVNGLMIGNTDKILKSAVVVDNYKVYYTFKKKNDSESLNAMGNFYRFSHQQKQIQKFLEAYFIKNEKINKARRLNVFYTNHTHSIHNQSAVVYR